MIKESVEDDSKRIIMYADDEGRFKGEALISKYMLCTCPTHTDARQSTREQSQ